MENLLKLEELANRFIKDAKSLSTLTTFGEIDAMERQCLQELQAIESVAANAVYRDLYTVVQDARRALQNKPLIKEENGDNSETESSTDTERGESEPVKKAKSTNRGRRTRGPAKNSGNTKQTKRVNKK